MTKTLIGQIFPFLLFYCNLIVSQSNPQFVVKDSRHGYSSLFDSIQYSRPFYSALLCQPKLISGVHGIIISKQGLALLPASVLDSTQFKKKTWLTDQPEGLDLSLRGIHQLALISAIEDITTEILSQIPDTLSSAARSIKIANAIMRLNRENNHSDQTTLIQPLYLGNRFYRITRIFLKAQLLGQVYTPQGISFAIVQLQTDPLSKNNFFSHFPIHTDESSYPKDLFLYGYQTFPQEILPPSGISFYYTELLPLLNEVQLILSSSWEGAKVQPAWLDNQNERLELEMPLHPFSDPAKAIAEARKQENTFLQSQSRDPKSWLQYQQIQQTIESENAALSPLLTAQKLSLEVIPTRLQLFSLIRLFIQLEKSLNNDPERVGHRTKNIAKFLEDFYHHFDPVADQKAAEKLFELYLDHIRYDLQSPTFIEQWIQAEKNVAILAAALYEKSHLTDGVNVQKNFQENPVLFFKQLHDNFAYQFVLKWESEHEERIRNTLKYKEELLREAQRKMIKGFLEFMPEKAGVEKGGVSYTPLSLKENVSTILSHVLGNYPVGSPVISTDGHLEGITYYEGNNSLLSGQTSNKALSINFLEQLKKEYPSHFVTLMLFPD